MNTTKTCAHFDDGTSDPESGMFTSKAGQCLFDKRNWSPACSPQRCNDCPNVVAMPANSALSNAITALYTNGVLTGAERDKARKRLATVKDCLTVASDVKECLTTEPVSLPYKFGELPWVVTMKESGGWRFLIDSRDPENRDMFSGFYINAHGKIGEKSLTTGAGGRYNYHRSYFIDELPE